MKTTSLSLKEIALGGRGTFSNGPFGSDLVKADLTETGVPVVYIRDIRDASYRRVSTSYVTEEKAESLASCQVEPGDILIAKVGDPPGIAAIYPEDEPLGIMTQDVVRLRVNPEAACAKYVQLWLNSPLGKHSIKLITVEATRARFPLRDFKSLQIPLPPIAEQRRIAAILDKADAVRRKRKEAIALTEDLLRSAFLEMFGDPVTNSKRWKLSTIGEIAEIKTGKTPSRKEPDNYGGSVRWVKTTEVRNSVIEDTEEYLSEKGASKMLMLPKNTILIAMYGQGATRGRTALLAETCTTNQACAAILPSNKYCTLYLWTILRLSYEGLRSLGRGGNQPNLNLNMVKEFSIPLPPLEQQKIFESIVLNLHAQISKQRKGLQHSTALFNSLLQRAFRGDL